MKKTNRTIENSPPVRPAMVLLEVLSQTWAVRILWALRDKRLEFRQIQELCGYISSTKLNDRLTQLRDVELIDHNEQGFGYTKWGHELGNELLNSHNWSKN